VGWGDSCAPQMQQTSLPFLAHSPEVGTMSPICTWDKGGTEQVSELPSSVALERERGV
jgi:hypothetical protein